jgi:tight adherence protein B
MDPRTVFVAILAALAVIGIGFAFLGADSDKVAKRAKEMGGQAAARKGRRAALMDANSQRRRQFQDSIKELEQREKQARKQRTSVSGLIEQAGIKITLQTFWIASAAAGVVVFLLSLILGASLLIALGLGFASAFGAPRWVLGMLTKKRQQKFVEQFADSIDVIVRGVKSGLPLGECLKIIARESPEPCKQEFVRIVDGQTMGLPFEQNLTRLYNRVPVAEVNFFNTVLLIQQKTGGNLSEALGNLSTVIRGRKLMREKIGALSSEAKASAMIIGALPFFVMGAVYFMTPDYIMELFRDPIGHLILLGSGAWMGTGIFIMRKMINFSY